MNRGLRSDLLARLGPRALFDEPLARHTTWGVGGPAACLCRLERAAELVWLMQAAAKAETPLLVLGRGSNVLAADEGFDGVVAVLRGEMAQISLTGETVTCGGGASLPRLVRRCGESGLGGLEWAVGIPGTVGGAIAGNAGANDMDMAMVCHRMTLLMPGGAAEQFRCVELPAGYRSRALPPGSIVLEARLRLEPANPAVLAMRRREYLARRKAAQPLDARTAGSVFKNPPGDYAGRLIEAAGLKGLARGRARVSPVHANFIENTGGAAAADIRALIEHVADEVKRRTGVALEPEVEFIGG